MRQGVKAIPGSATPDEVVQRGAQPMKGLIGDRPGHGAQPEACPGDDVPAAFQALGEPLESGGRALPGVVVHGAQSRQLRPAPLEVIERSVQVARWARVEPLPGHQGRQVLQAQEDGQSVGPLLLGEVAAALPAPAELVTALELFEVKGGVRTEDPEPHEHGGHVGGALQRALRPGWQGGRGGQEVVRELVGQRGHEILGAFHQGRIIGDARHLTVISSQGEGARREPLLGDLHQARLGKGL